MDDVREVQLSGKHQNMLDHFIKACQADERIIAAFLIGSYVNGKPDEHSDLDLCLVTADEVYDDFVATRELFVQELGEPAFMEDFNIPNILFLIFPDGSEVEFNYARESQLSGLFNAPYKVLLDKQNLTENITFNEREVDKAEQTEKLRRFIYWFWHDFSHFVTAIGRNQLWWARGELEILRSMCVGLARLKHNFSDSEVEEEVYFKIDKAMPTEPLSPLKETFVSIGKEALMDAAFVILDFYREKAIPLAKEHEIVYPVALEKALVARLEKIRNENLS